MENKKIGFFETYNKVSGMVEKSSTRLQQLLVLIFAFVYNIMYLNQNCSIDINYIMLNLVFLLAAFAPKYLKDLVDLKEKLGK